tara:strand:- start:3632 stop:4255 length:624 start_codon:yes stop_codon:yes gene_type:complete
MKFTKKILTSDLGWEHYHDNDTRFFLVFCFLHKAGLINHARLKGNLANLNAKKIFRALKTYHCTIQDKWYNDESYLTVLEDLTQLIPNNCTISFDEMMGYLLLRENKKRNYLLDCIYYEILEPLCNIHSVHDRMIALKSIDAEGFNPTLYESYDQMDDRGRLDGSYCCKDCDGCYSEYKASIYRSIVGEQEHSGFFQSYITKLKKPR